jgi:hypothetical protein
MITHPSLSGWLVLWPMAVAAAAPATQQAGEPIVIRVTPTGPIPSLIAARDELRHRRSLAGANSRPARIVVAAGSYVLDEPLLLGPEDGGTASAPVTYEAEARGRVIISGGRRITGWRQGELNRRPAWAADLPEVKAGAWNFRELFVDGQRRPRSRLPKSGFYRFTGSPQFRKDAPYNQGYDCANFQPGQIRNWHNPTDLEVVVLHFWVAPRLQVAEVDETASLVRFTRKTHRRLTDSFRQDRFARYYVENVAEACTEAGDWYLDRSAGTLYYLPRPGETMAGTEIIAPRLSELVRIAGPPGPGPAESRPVAGITLRGLVFEHAEWYDPAELASDSQAAIKVPGAVVLENARACRLEGCAVRHVSNYGIEVRGTSRDVVIADNVVSDLGAGGIQIGHGSSSTTVCDNDIADGGHLFHNAVGVWIGHSPKNRVAHNDIHHFYYTGVSVGWVWGYGKSAAVENAITDNHIHHIGRGMLSDMAGVYTLGVSPGTRICHNLIHDVEADNYGGWGLYTDEGSTGILMEDNVVYRTTHGGFHQHYGRENVVRNNILAFASHAQVMRTREEQHTSFTFERNIVLFREPELLGGNWKNDRYEMDRNLYYRVGGQAFTFAGASLEAWRARGHDRNSIVADPRLADPDRDDYSLRPDSPADRIGFVPIEMGSFGRRHH